ncbi:SAE2 C-terminal domain-containing protein [Aspergillus melleus]|uniref:SAE2 C-terminal domain-containing protein n=1 Tax=Aspergillus melleus TaxID=138277 RepID=UPI001E8CEF46|nr:uncharacterized protein LDX57_000718 [Aspergillus melleus]KAH8422962.1 hypothetical protein LDX57_000718 [Aspergillus melleus]
MDVLKSLHASVAQTFEKTFDDAYRDLYAEIKSRDCKVEEAEKKAKCAEEAWVESAAEARELKREIAILQGELARNDVNAEDTQVSADQIFKLKETFSPQHILIFGDTHAGLDTGSDSKPNEIVKDKYAALYNEFMTLIKATDGLRLQIKRQKRKLTYWRECLDREKFTLVLDGIPVKFERKQSTVGESQLQRPKRCHETKLSSCAAEGSKKAGSKPRSKQSSPQPGGHYGMASPNPQDKQPNQSLLPCEPVEACNSISTLSAAGNELNNQNACSKADNMREPSISKNRCLELCKSSSGVPPSEDSVVDSKRKVSNLRSEQMSPHPTRGPSHQAESHQIAELSNKNNKPNSPQERQYNTGLHHEDTSPTVLPSSLGGADNNFRVSVANPGSSSHPTYDPLHINPRSDYDGSAGSGRRHEKVMGRSLKHALSSLAEDGDEVVRKRRMGNSPRDASSGAKCTQFHFSEDAAITERRLHNLLESPLPPRPSLQQRKSIQIEVDGEHSHQHKELGLTKSVDIDVSSSIRPTPAQGEETQVPRARCELPSDPSFRANDCEASEMHPGDEPYRARPLRRLDLSHFKINPNYNQGLDFAYDDVVRKRHERDSIQGCTRPNCCGQKFLAMARLGGLPTHQEKCPSEDREIMEDFLGEEKGIIDRMTTTEYQDILHEAKARLMANQYGRHRHHHQRPSTPPGFWRADMPDTQEVEYDREEALKMEREKVKERYRQAMRPGGLWKFADE